MIKALTAIAIGNLKPRAKRYELADGGCTGLRVVIFPSGKKSFVLRYRFRGAQKKLTLGPCLTVRRVTEPAVTPQLGTPLSLAAARQLATTARREAKSGTDPGAEKKRKLQEEREANTTCVNCGAKPNHRTGSVACTREAPVRLTPATPRYKVKRRSTERERERSRERGRKQALAFAALKKLGLDHLLTTEDDQ